MTARTVRSAAVVVGVAPTLAAGALAGGWWWAVAAAGAIGAIGAYRDRQFAQLQVLALLTLALGLQQAAAVWFVPVVVAGTLGSLELAAAADRTTVVRPRVPDLPRSLGTIAGAGALTALVLVAGLVPVATSAAVLVAAAAGVMAVRVVAR